MDHGNSAPEIGYTLDTPEAVSLVAQMRADQELARELSGDLTEDEIKGDMLQRYRYQPPSNG